MFTFATVIGVITPPLGANLFVASQISGTSFEDIVKHIWPWIVTLMIGIAIVVAIPQLSLWVPNLLLGK